MPKITVYLPDDLAKLLRASDLNVSAVVQQALRHELLLEDSRREIAEWVADHGALDEEEVADKVRRIGCGHGHQRR